MNTFYDCVKSRGIEIIKDEPLKNHTTFKIGGNAKYFVLPADENEIISVLEEAEKHKERVLVLGNGSNMLISDNGFDGVVIYIGEKMSEISFIDETTVKAQAGALLVSVCRKAQAQSLSSMERLYGIPGSVGGGLYMNAGAYGSEMKDVVLSAEYIYKNKQLCNIELDDMDLSYRHSFFSDKKYIITSVTFRLKKSDKAEIKALMDEYMQKRRDKQPVEYPSAGSVFKRPEGYFAGALIEQSGLKGRKIGGAQVSEKHAGFIINTGGATQSDVSELIGLCQKTVFEKTGVKLETEIKCIE
ncbi:MAG: UDP-N-acetylmuramate dehydrogenase [Acutalibacteraceae bacterium]